MVGYIYCQLFLNVYLNYFIIHRRQNKLQPVARISTFSGPYIYIKTLKQLHKVYYRKLIHSVLCIIALISE